MKGFKDSSGKFHPMTDSKGVRKSRDQSAKTQGVKIERKKKEGVLGKDFHIYRIWSFESDEGNSDRREIAHVKAKNVEEATEFVKKQFVIAKHRNDLNEDGDDNSTYISKSFAYNENGEELTQKEIDKLEESGDEDEINWQEVGFQIEEDDDEEEDFNTIYGGNDFYDLTKPKGQQHGFTSDDAVKKAGSAQEAFFHLGGGQGFESGNPDNSYNLNNQGKLILYDPTKKQKGK